VALSARVLRTGDESKNEKLKDLSPREIFVFAPLLVLALGIGVYPKPLFQILEQPVNGIVQTARGTNFPLKAAPVNAEAAKPVAPATGEPKAAPVAAPATPVQAAPAVSQKSDNSKPVAMMAQAGK
jgi:NADH-quinone oxidoreductase subunit M